MKNLKSNFFSDISLVAMLVLLFLCAGFLSIDTDNVAINLPVLCLVFVIMIITHFTSITTGLIIDVVAIFISLSVTIYISITKGYAIETYIYFWIIMLPLLTLVIGLISRSTVRLQRENTELQNRVSTIVTIDELTGLKNVRAFENDAYMYMKISKRYEHELVLMVLDIRFKKEIQRMLGPQETDNLIVKISDALPKCLRGEDTLYRLDNENFQWGLLLLTNINSINVVKNRIRQVISEMDVSDITRSKKLNVELVMGSAPYSGEPITPFEFLEEAQRQMEYDV